MTQGEKKELYVLASNMEDHRLRALIFALLKETGFDPAEKTESTPSETAHRRR